MFIERKMKKFKIKRITSFLLAGLFLLLFLFVYTHTAYADEAEPEGWGVTNILKPILISILFVVKVIPTLGLGFLKWILDPSIINGIFSAGIIYALWSMVRDLLNIFFVMLLLISAFATIFQIEKYNYKKIFVRLIIAAFLVNFSFPIARVLIDFSNVLLYSLLNLISNVLGLGEPSKSAVTLFNAGNFSELVTAGGKAKVSVLVSLIVSLFLMGISLLAMGFLLLIRIFALVLLVIFSPIAFMAPVVPGASQFGSMWWKYLLNYSFFAPIMMLFFYIAIAFMEVLNQVGDDKLIATSAEQTSTLSPEVLAAMVFSLIPIFIIWIGIGMASKFGIQGAEATMGRAKKLASWAGNLPGRGAKGVWRGTGIPGAWQKNVEHIKRKGALGFGGSERRERNEALIAGKVFRVPGSADYKERQERQKMEDYKKLGVKERAELARKGDSAAARSLAEEGALESGDYQAFMAASGHNKKKTRNAALDKTLMEKNRTDVLIAHRKTQIDPSLTGAARNTAVKKVYEDNLGGMSAEKLAKQEKLHETIDSDPDLEEYMQDQITDPTTFEFHKEMFKRMGKNAQRKYASRPMPLNP